MPRTNHRPKQRLSAITIWAAALLSGCNRPAEVHYRVTVEVNDNGTLRTGSAIWSVALAKSLLPLASPYNPRFRGEAVRVVIPGKGELYGLVDFGLAEMYPENLFGDLNRSRKGPPRFADRTEDLRHIAGMKGARADLVCMNPPWIGLSCPTMIRFRDRRDPRTVEELDPVNLSKSLGPGVRLNRVYVEITDEPVTREIKRELPWLGSDDGYSTDLNPRSRQLLSHLRGDY